MKQTRRSFFAFALACVGAAATGATPARAFVTPRWDAMRESRRATLLGRWSVITQKKSHSSSQVHDPGIEIVFTRTELRVERAGFSSRASWKIVRQDGDLLEVQITDAKGKHHDLDVLVEGSDALTIYVRDDDGEDEEAMRLERVR
ncbi:MAG: hypothetical protein HYV09_18950 [Deltaproteobacteria bacterium]|nr:hypothetical protein [Deltaproteobacteria bacterium]